MLGALAAVALIIGGISTATILTDENRIAADESKEAVVEVQAVQSADKAPADAFNF